jgi:site-specific DNA-methyltransferase (adenine-specific)
MDFNNLPAKDKIYYQDDSAVIYCADNREILPLFPDKAFDLVLTDPPYGVGIKYDELYDDKRDGYWEWFLPVVKSMVQLGKIAIFTHRNESLRHIIDSDWVGVWNKPGSFGARIGNSAILPHWEPIFFYGIHTAGVKGEYCPDVLTYNPEKAGGNSTIGREKWQESDNFKFHPCPKPIELFARLVRVFSTEADLILDPFLGSGTTAVAAKILGRKCIGIEISEKYCEIAAKRLSQSVMQLEIPKEDVKQSKF